MGTSGLCHFFMSGNCRYGERCRNIHGVPLPPPYTTESALAGTGAHPRLGFGRIGGWARRGSARCVTRSVSIHATPRAPTVPPSAASKAKRQTKQQPAAHPPRQPPRPNRSGAPPLTPPARSMRSGTAPLLRAAAARAEHRRKCAAEKARNLVVPGGGVSTADPECAIWCGGARSLRAARASAIDAGMERWFRARGPTGAQCVVRMAWFDFAALSIS